MFLWEEEEKKTSSSSPSAWGLFQDMQDQQEPGDGDCMNTPYLSSMHNLPINVYY